MILLSLSKTLGLKQNHFKPQVRITFSYSIFSYRIFFFFLSSSLSLAWNSGGLTREGTAAARAALPIPISVCAVFSCVQAMVWLPDLGFGDWDWDFGIRNVRTRLIAGAVYGNSESLHWKLTVGEKSLVAPGNRTRVRIFASGFSVGRFTNWAISAPRHRLYNWNPSK